VTLPRIRRAGEHALLLEFPELADAVAMRAALERAPIPGVTDAVSGARTVMIRFDPKVTSRAAVEAAVLALEVPAGLGAAGQGEPVEIPVVYDGPDLPETARLLGLSPESLVDEHTRHAWVCAFGGFAPGFGYLASEGWMRTVPRLDSPRTRVPAGAVGLAGEFSGVYPRESPGGWRIIGHTDLAMWDLARTPPALLTAGNAVRFIEADWS